MSERTYNTGRVVGWSSYEEFLKETGIDPNVITPFIYQTLVTYGVTRLVALSATGWQESTGGKFFTQTVQVPGASWGAIPIIGLDYESYLTVFDDPTSSTSTTEELDEQDKAALEQAIGNVFSVYVSDENGVKVANSAMNHGYLTFVAHPDVLNFESNVQNIDGSTLKLIVRGLSMEDLDVDELYYGPQGLVFAGNGLSESCYHKSVNINNLLIQASSYISLAITGFAASSGGSYQMYDDVDINLEGVVSGYINIDRLRSEGFVLDYSEIDTFITTARTAGLVITTDAYDVIPVPDRQGYDYLVYGSDVYRALPSVADPIYVLCVRKSDGYTGIGVLLDVGARAKLGYDSQNPDNPPTLPLRLSYSSRDGADSVLLLKDRNMPDYIGAYWSQVDGWNGFVSYFQSYNRVDLTWSQLKTDYNAVFTDAGRSSYIECAIVGGSSSLPVGSIVRITGDVNAGEPADLIHGVYVCTANSGGEYQSIVLNRRGGYLISDTSQASAIRAGATYSRLPGWSLTLSSDASGQYLVDSSDSSRISRIYRNELIWVEKAGTEYGYSSEWVCVNIETDGNPDLIVFTAPFISLDNAVSGISPYTGAWVNSLYTNAIQSDNLSSLLPTNIDVYASPDDSATSSSYTLTRGGQGDQITVGTLVLLQHSVSDVFGENCGYWYQYIGESSGHSVLVSSVSQKGGTTFYTLAKMTSHLNQGFPRSKQLIPDLGGSYYYDYPRAISRLTVEQFFSDFGLDITQYLHPDFRGTSYLKFLQNLIVYQHLGKPISATNKKSVGFTARYNLFTIDSLNGMIGTPPTEVNPTYSRLRLAADTDPTSFSSPGFFTADYVHPSDGAFSLANPDYPIWATIAKSRSGNQIMSASLFDGDGNRLNGSGTNGVINKDTVVPNDVLVALATGKSIDVLNGMKVRKTSSGSTYLVMDDGTRLYVATQEPVASAGNPIPDGSIGIGW